MAGLRLLALDGGGVRGLVTLHILNRLLYLMNPGNPPKPCEVFDIIAGTSTGGLIAIMLGLFEMDVQTCIRKYQDLAKVVFTPRKRARVFGRVLPSVLGAAPFDNKLLEQEIKRLSLERFGDENAPLFQDSAMCKTFVCTSLSNGEITRLRSYKSQHEDSLPCSIWEAGRATSAAPTFFDPITFSNGVIFRDGALEANNPVYELVQEAMAEFPSTEIDAIVSIGTGVPASINIGSGLISVAKACTMIATSTEKIARQFEVDYCASSRPLQGKYFRFNVTKGVEAVRLEEWQKTDVMISNTLSYLGRPSTREKLILCIRRLGGDGKTEGPSKVPWHRDRRRRSPAGSMKSAARTTVSNGFGDVQDPPSSGRQIGFLRKIEAAVASTDNDRDETVALRNPFYQLDRIGKDPVPYFVPRGELAEIGCHFADINNINRTRVVCLLGLGGSGKTQLALQYAWSSREEFGVVLWADGSSHSTLQDSFRLAASQLGLRLPWNVSNASSCMALETYSKDDMKDVVSVTNELRRRNQPWLMILDQVDDEDLLDQLSKYMPSDAHGHILLTSRRQEAYRLGQRHIKVDSLPSDSAVSLLLYHTGVQSPTNKQLQVAAEIVDQLDCIALAVDLAGSYIQTPNGLQNYLDFYRSNKEELYRRSLAKIPPRLSGYKYSVFVTWQISIAAMPRDVAKLLHLLCFLDPTNLSKELLRRACSPKRHWNSEGQIAMLHPSECGVPTWLLELLRETDGEWSDMKFHEAVSALESLFFVRQEIFQGSWLHETGTVDASSLVADGGDLVLLRLPRPLHDLGRYFLTEEERRNFSYAAFSVAVQSFQNGLGDISDLNDSSMATLYVGEGGQAKDGLSLRRELEQFRRHVEVFRNDIWQNQRSRPMRTVFDQQHPPWYEGEVVMFATISWRHHLRAESRGNSSHVVTSVIKPWEALMRIAETILRDRNQHPGFNSSGIWSGDNQQGWKSQSGSFPGPISSFEDHPSSGRVRSNLSQQKPNRRSQDDSGAQKTKEGDGKMGDSEFAQAWVIRQSRYFELLARSEHASAEFVTYTASMYRLTAMAESLSVRFTLDSGQGIMPMSRFIEWLRTTTFGEISMDKDRETNKAETESLSTVLEMNWKASFMGQQSLQKWGVDLDRNDEMDDGREASSPCQS